MAEETTSGERTEDATGKRRGDFRDKGQVAQSKEVQTAAILTIMLLFWIFYMPFFFNKFTALLTYIFSTSSEVEITPESTMITFIFIVKKLALLLLPLFFIILITGFLATFFQIGWLFTTKTLQFDLTKFNPITGFKKFFSTRSILDMFKSMCKVSLIAWVAYSTAYDNFDKALMLIDSSIIDSLIFLGKTAALILSKICAILIFLAFIDYLYVRWDMEQKMKMTKQEVKEEFKETEGDPLVKRQIRTIQRQMAQRRMMAEVPGADVIVTNPTHISVAIRYDAEKMDAPTVVAKGMGVVAMNIRKIALENDIPIIENPPVARLLHKIDLDTAIPEELFKAVAEILAHVYSLKGKNI